VQRDNFPLSRGATSREHATIAHEMDEPSEYRGQWWLPAAPERRIAGDFSVRDRLMELSLEGPLFTDQRQQSDDLPLIYGVARGQELTLIMARPLLAFLQPFVAFQIQDAVLGRT